MKTSLNPFGLIGFGLASTFAVGQDWSLPEFCWSAWLAGLAYAWSCILAAALQILATAGPEKALYERQIPWIERLSPGVFLTGVALTTLSAGFLAFALYSFVFAFYGLFLSVFSEMEPLDLFGRDGFINSDFLTPLIYLLQRYWPMAVAVLITNWKDFFDQTPWKRILLPFQKEVLRMHVMIVALPVLSLLAWAVFGDGYQSITILLLLGVFHLLPKMTESDRSRIQGN